MKTQSLPEGLEEKLVEINKRIIELVDEGKSGEMDAASIAAAIEDLIFAVPDGQVGHVYDETPYLPPEYFEYYCSWARSADGTSGKIEDAMSRVGMEFSLKLKGASENSVGLLEGAGFQQASKMARARAAKIFRERDMEIARLIHASKTKQCSFGEKASKINQIMRKHLANMEEGADFCKRLPALAAETCPEFHAVIFREDAPLWSNEKMYCFIDEAAKIMKGLPHLFVDGNAEVPESFQALSREVISRLPNVRGDVLYRAEFFTNLGKIAFLSNTLDAGEIIETASLHIPEYLIYRKLGEGADGIVYLAANSLLGDVKIKVFKDPEDKVKKAIDAEGATIEERMWARMDNLKCVADKSRLVEFYGVGRCKNPRTGKDTVHLVLEYVDGGSVETKTSGGYAIRDDIKGDAVMYVFREFLKGLRSIHEAGKVLKDIKLRNLLVSLDHKTVKIDDLETIAGTDEVRSGSRLTEGSDRYAAPEVIKDIRNASPQSDLYSAAVCLLYMITRKPTLMLGINTRSVISYRRELKKMLDSQGLSSRQKEFFEKALERSPAARYQSAQEMAFSLG